MIRRPIRRMTLRLRRLVLRRLLHADDPPHRLAFGMAIGVFVALTPTVGIQMVIAVFLAWMLRANKAVAAAAVWISNPATVVPIYYWCYLVGSRILGATEARDDWWSQLNHPPVGWWPAVTFYWTRLMEIAAPLWTGSLVVAALLAYPAYQIVYLSVRAYRLRRWGQLMPPTRRGLSVRGDRAA